MVPGISRGHVQGMAYLRRTGIMISLQVIQD